MTMHSLYDAARQKFGTSQLNWLNCNPRLFLIGSGYTPDVTHEFLSEVPSGARVSVPLVLSNVSMDKGVARADPVVVGPGYAGALVSGGVLYALGSDDASSTLIAFYSSVLGLPTIVPVGGSTWQWDAINGAFKV